MCVGCLVIRKLGVVAEASPREGREMYVHSRC